MMNRSVWLRRILAGAGSAIVLFALSACALDSKPAVTEQQARVDYDLLLSVPDEPISYEREIKPLVGRRCVVCQGCYDAPCQLKLSSPEGLARGASKQKVYDGARILAMEPTRLFVDAKSTEEWRTKGFYPVLNEADSDPESNLENTTLYQMLRLKQLHPQPRVGMLPESFDLGLDRNQECPGREEFDDYARRHPLWGMPYAMPNLTDEEIPNAGAVAGPGSPGGTGIRPIGPVVAPDRSPGAISQRHLDQAAPG